MPATSTTSPRGGESVAKVYWYKYCMGVPEKIMGELVPISTVTFVTRQREGERRRHKDRHKSQADKGREGGRERDKNIQRRGRSHGCILVYESINTQVTRNRRRVQKGLGSDISSTTKV